MAQGTFMGVSYSNASARMHEFELLSDKFSGTQALGLFAATPTRLERTNGFRPGFPPHPGLGARKEKG
jgi:hypothetical protein